MPAQLKIAVFWLTDRNGAPHLLAFALLSSDAEYFVEEVIKLFKQIHVAPLSSEIISTGRIDVNSIWTKPNDRVKEEPSDTDCEV